MKIEVTPEVILAQLGYSKNDNSISQMSNIIKNTKNFDKFAKHILSLNDFLKHVHAFIAPSNSKDYLKIKCETTSSKEIIEEFHQKIANWSQKYKVLIEKVPNRETYYILGTAY